MAVPGSRFSRLASVSIHAPNHALTGRWTIVSPRVHVQVSWAQVITQVYTQNTCMIRMHGPAHSQWCRGWRPHTKHQHRNGWWCLPGGAQGDHAHRQTRTSPQSPRLCGPRFPLRAPASGCPSRHLHPSHKMFITMYFLIIMIIITIVTRFQSGD
jgi:hypothetical protein